MDITNDPASTPDQRIEALRAVVADEHFPSWVPESNNHIHTCASSARSITIRSARQPR